MIRIRDLNEYPEQAVEFDLRRLWKTSYAHPLVCNTNEYLPNRCFIYNAQERNLGGKEGMAGVVEFTFEYKILCAAPQMRALQKHDASFTVLLCQNDKEE